MPAMDCSHIAATKTSHRFVEKALSLSPTIPIGLARNAEKLLLLKRENGFGF
jgi:hypothetical protein